MSAIQFAHNVAFTNLPPNVVHIGSYEHKTEMFVNESRITPFCFSPHFFCISVGNDNLHKMDETAGK